MKYGQIIEFFSDVHVATASVRPTVRSLPRQSSAVSLAWIGGQPLVAPGCQQASSLVYSFRPIDSEPRQRYVLKREESFAEPAHPSSHEGPAMPAVQGECMPSSRLQSMSAGKLQRAVDGLAHSPGSKSATSRFQRKNTGHLAFGQQRASSTLRMT